MCVCYIIHRNNLQSLMYSMSMRKSGMAHKNPVNNN